MSGEELRELRGRAGLSQRELAARIGVRSNTVSRWELGRRRIAKPTERAIVHLLAEVRQRAAARLRRQAARERAGG